MPLNVREAAAYVGIDPKLLRQKLRDRVIPGMQNGVTWTVETSDLDAYLRGVRGRRTPRGQTRNASLLFRETDLDPGSAVPVVASTLSEPTSLGGGFEPLASWSGWVSFAEAAQTVPRQPGVYIARETQSRNIVYVGMAAERSGNGMRGRLAIYARGRGATSGLGEGAMDRALMDPDWLRERLAEAEQGTPMRAKNFARLAVDRADLQICWSETTDGVGAAALEILVLRSFDGLPLWNRRR